MDFIKTAVKRPVAVAMLFVAIAILGIVSFNKISVDLLPKITYPMAIVITNYSGAAPEEVEATITKPLEEALGTVQNIDTINSVSSSGSSMVMVMFNWDADMNFATLQMREKIDLVKGAFPADVGTPTVIAMDPSMLPIIGVGLSGGEDLTEFKQLVDETIKPSLERQTGVASVEMYGGYDEEAQVILDPVKLDAYHITYQQVRQALAMNNMNLAAGNIEDNNKNISVRMMGKMTSLDDIANTYIALSNGGGIYVRDVAEVKGGTSDLDNYVWLNGSPGVYLSILKQSDANTVETVNAVKAELQRLSEDLPAGMKIGTVFDQGQYIQYVIDGLYQNVLLGSILAMLVLCLFLRSFRSMLVIGLSIPISILFACVIMYFNGMTMNMMTLSGLALGAGMIVDSSIVILENIQRLRTKGLPGEEAATKGAKELALAIAASTLTTVCVFLPIAFVEGLASMIFNDLALTVTYALLASLVVALTLIPMISARMLRPEPEVIAIRAGAKGVLDRVNKRVTTFLNNLYDGYGRLLAKALCNRGKVILIVTALFVLSFGSLAVIGKEFMPAMDSGQVKAVVKMEQGTSSDVTNEVAKSVEKIIESLGDDVQDVFTIVGGSSDSVSMESLAANTAEIYVQLKPLAERNISDQEAAELIRKQTKDLAGAEIEVTANDAMSMSMETSDISISISGSDLNMLSELSEQIKGIVAETPGTREVTSSLDDALPELQVHINNVLAASYGITVSDVSSLIQANYGGVVATTYTPAGSGKEVDVRLMLPDNTNDSLSDLLTLKLQTAGGAVINLGDIVTLEKGMGPLSISRENQTRKIDITCSVMDRDLNSVIKDIKTKLNDVILPQSYTLTFGGEYEEMMDSFVSLGKALLLSLVLVYIVMAALYESFIQPFIIMFSVPTAFIGVFLGLLLSGNSLNVTSFIGVIMLVGIVVNNGIILVDCVNALRREGQGVKDALIEAGTRRLRPILMTALTTILGMLPMAIAMGEGAEMRQGLAITVIAGLSTSVFFTLFYVPVIYSYVDDFRAKRRKKRERKRVAKNARLEAE